MKENKMWYKNLNLVFEFWHLGESRVLAVQTIASLIGLSPDASGRSTRNNYFFNNVTGITTL